MTAADLSHEMASADAWQFIRWFAETWATPLLPGDGCDEAELGVSLPASLRRAYELFGRRFDLTRSQDRLLAPDEVHVDDTGDVLIFRVENQHVAEWGVPLTAVNEPDPPVVFRCPSFPAAERAWQPFLATVSLACVEMVLSEWMFSGGEFTDNRELDDGDLVVLEERFRRLPMPDYPLWAGGGPMRWFAGDGVILRVDAGTWLWCRAQSAEAIVAVREVLPGEWLMEEA
ncbi:hypothetical protein [Paractinoplanes atraurantiacus]|uniref:SMI1/KNR4 family protein n=1 Tax=Paractinoplanes atraurantiacus TaxID=1036182 RepID=A0A285FQ76_9ACTN|nr:hypothetical protein [Actinoplanes atraurantiacus]SNY12476.1 hypothetical protein SAMN05421748_1011029 [Actinoplanes atraurantiacus]